MNNLDDFFYSKINLSNYQERLNNLLKNEKLKELHIKHTILGKTHYNYNIDCITIGNGDKELFIIGGTHGSEIITTDFILNFINQLPHIKDFDPNKIKLIIIPLQNPEGFDISTNTTKEITDIDFTNTSYEYYFKYKIDHLIVNVFNSLNNMFNKNTTYNPLALFQNFIKTNTNWINLTTILPNMNALNHQINNTNKEIISTYNDLFLNIINTCNKTILSNPTNLKEQAYNFFILELKNFILTNQLSRKLYINKNKKLHQEMFKTSTFEGTQSKSLAFDTKTIYIENNHPKGSQISHDATGIGINLNANNILNPGINNIKTNKTIYGPDAKSNIKNYTKGPLGIPTLDINNFEYAKENLLLENLIKDSVKKGAYLATILYHGTGGLIYYKPHQELMDKKTYQEYYQYNEELANIYQKDTHYKILNESDSTGYGDYLRRTYPGVLLIELSKMGGNPIGPYGDKNNTYEVFNDNTLALSSILKKLNKK